MLTTTRGHKSSRLCDFHRSTAAIGSYTAPDGRIFSVCDVRRECAGFVEYLAVSGAGMTWVSAGGFHVFQRPEVPVQRKSVASLESRARAERKR